MLKPSIDYYSKIHDKLVSENSTIVSEYAKSIEHQISELLENQDISENLLYSINDFKFDEFIMPDYIEALTLVSFKLKSLGYDCEIYTSNLTIKF